MVIAELLHDPLVHVASVGALSLLLGAAALHKLHEPRAFADVLQRYAQVLGAWCAAPVWTYALPMLEVLGAAGLLLGLWWPWTALPAVCLLVLYAGVLALAVRQGSAIEDCGCHFGGRPQPPAPALAWRNLLLALLACNLLAPMAERPLTWLDAFTLVFVFVSAAAVYLLANLLISNRASLRQRP
ncbi:methylamine utilization protein MauE [Pseudomonas asiatica]|uniref:MauE/DoxX family redox-associated membrane protein n=1 Tax=Pseudomonas TaxID=286 RepID=UPI000A1F5D0D|nr:MULTISPECIES: MauE/DoxX family redox-associated membrane protein [Pseudomonas]MBA6109928.1 methylamine utilization protein MauE [Pseudomonas asiatica]